MRNLFVIAKLEIRMGMRNRWLLATSVLMTLLALSISMLGSAPTGTLDVDVLTLSSVSLASLTIFLVPLMALLLSYDGLVGEIDQGTMLLLLSYPVSRVEVVLGKFIGQSSIIGFATLVGYGLAGLFTALSQETMPPTAGWIAFATMIGSAILLGAAFVALGLFFSAIARHRSSAAGAVVSLWLFFVIIFDLLLLGALISGFDQMISASNLSAIMMANPADVFRNINMSGLQGSGLIGGMAEISSKTQLSLSALWGSLVVWCLLPLGAAILFFKKRDI